MQMLIESVNLVMQLVKNVLTLLKINVLLVYQADFYQDLLVSFIVQLVRMQIQLLKLVLVAIQLALFAMQAAVLIVQLVRILFI